MTDLEDEETNLVKVNDDLDFIEKRITLLLSGQGKELEALVKKRFKVSRLNKNFERCGQLCILTRYDEEGKTSTCEACGHKSHPTCDLNNYKDEVDNLCQSCCHTTSYETLLESGGALRRKKQDDLNRIWSIKSQEELKLNGLHAEVQHFLGPSERAFEDLLEALGVKRTEYASCSFIGRHVEILIRNMDKIATLLPEPLQQGFKDFGCALNKLLPLTKAKRNLTDVEIAEVEIICNQIGVLYPQVFKGNTIIPKVCCQKSYPNTPPPHPTP